MTSILSCVWEILLYNLIQILVGLVLSILLYKFGGNYLVRLNRKGYFEVIMIVFFALLGIVLPIGTFGIIPVVAVLITLKIRTTLIIPFILSNAFFNMLLPYSDISFTWHNGTKRIILAFIAGVLSGIILKIMRREKINLFRDRAYLLKGHFSASDQLTCILNNVGIMIIYLAVGAFADTLFKSYAYEKIMSLIFSGSALGSVSTSLTSLNVTNPFSILSLKISETLMDLVKLSAFCYLLKPRGWVLYYVYYCLIAALMAVSIFF